MTINNKLRVAFRLPFLLEYIYIFYSKICSTSGTKTGVFYNTTLFFGSRPVIPMVRRHFLG